MKKILHKNVQTRKRKQLETKNLLRERNGLIQKYLQLALPSCSRKCFFYHQLHRLLLPSTSNMGHYFLLNFRVADTPLAALFPRRKRTARTAGVSCNVWRVPRTHVTCINAHSTAPHILSHSRELLRQKHILLRNNHSVVIQLRGDKTTLSCAEHNKIGQSSVRFHRYHSRVRAYINSNPWWPILGC